MESYELLGLLDAPGTRSGMGDEAPFVGRETELAWVASRLAEVDDGGEPRVLLLTAEAGLGKTRFAAQVAAARRRLRRDVAPVRGRRRYPGARRAVRRLRRAPPPRAADRPGPVAIGLPTEAGAGGHRARRSRSG